jgi:hypothetical protein
MVNKLTTKSMKRLAFIPFCILTLFASGQDISNNYEGDKIEHGVILKGGVGTFNSLKSDGGFALNFGLHIPFTQNQQIKLGYTKYDEYIIFTIPDLKFNEFNLMYGRSLNYKYAKLTGYIGISHFSGSLRGEFLRETNTGSEGMGPGWFGSSIYEEIAFNTIGVPIEFELSFFPDHYLGFGTSLMFNLNPKNSIACLVLKLELGR